MFINIIAGLSIVAELAFIGILLFCCYRTKSKGVILLSATLLLTSRIFNAIFSHFFNPYIDQWAAGEMSNWLTQSMTIGQFILTVSYIKSFLYKSLCVLGILLIYREWRQGKFRQPSPEHREELAV